MAKSAIGVFYTETHFGATEAYKHVKPLAFFLLYAFFISLYHPHTLYSSHLCRIFVYDFSNRKSFEG